MTALCPPPHPPTPIAAVTHGHVDHVGALPLLLQAYPSTPVLLHSLEAPYLLSSDYYIPWNGLVARMWRLTGLEGSEPLKARRHPDWLGAFRLAAWACLPAWAEWAT